jgi:NCAIR mutase (PurE)-related protein
VLSTAARCQRTAAGFPAANRTSVAQIYKGFVQVRCYNSSTKSEADKVNEKLKLLLEQVAGGSVSVEEALSELRHLPYEDLDFAKIDHHRGIRDHIPEVVLGLGKTPDQVAAIGKRLADETGRLLVTRLDRDGYRALQAAVPDAEYDELARTATVDRDPQPLLPGVTVVCAGTSDLPVAREAATTARMMGSDARLISDVGVAGIHRLFDHLDGLMQANVIVVIAGMEGALPSVVSGLVAVPVIAVPTSIGYGASFNGLAPLLAMLNSCAAGVSVVNIDNGFGAGYLAGQINRISHNPPRVD